MASSVSGQDEPNRTLWLATRAGKMEPSCPLGTTHCIPQAKFPLKPCKKSFIDQVCLVMMAGYWPHSFFASLWTETKSRSMNSQKKTRPISSHLDRTNLVNTGFIIWLLVKFCLRDTAGSPEQARWLHFARSGSQLQRTIWFILPARKASHIIYG